MQREQPGEIQTRSSDRAEGAFGKADRYRPPGAICGRYRRPRDSRRGTPRQGRRRHTNRTSRLDSKAGYILERTLVDSILRLLVYFTPMDRNLPSPLYSAAWSRRSRATRVAQAATARERRPLLGRTRAVQHSWVVLCRNWASSVPWAWTARWGLEAMRYCSLGLVVAVVARAPVAVVGRVEWTSTKMSGEARIARSESVA